MLDSLRAVWRHHQGAMSQSDFLSSPCLPFELSTTCANAAEPTCLPQEVTGTLAAAGKLDALMFTPSGPAGVFAVYAAPGANLGRIFLNEFVCVRALLRAIPGTGRMAHPVCRLNRTSSSVSLSGLASTPPTLLRRPQPARGSSPSHSACRSALQRWYSRLTRPLIQCAHGMELRKCWQYVPLSHLLGVGPIMQARLTHPAPQSRPILRVMSVHA